MKLHELFNLHDSVAIVTGGTGHLGISMSEALAEAGAIVYITGTDENKCKKIASELENTTNGKLFGMKMDVSSTESIAKCYNEIFQNHSTIDILVNNAFYGFSNSSGMMSEKDWLNGIDGTINSVFRTTMGVIPFMKKQNSSSIINISSIYGIVSPDPSIYGDSEYNNPPSYGVGKAAIIQFTRYMACHFAKNGIRFNSVSPGSFPNKEVQKNTKFIRNLEKRIPLKRIGQPYELKGIISFLASEASSYVTGQNFIIDGGWTSW
jgi:gluconate 5-dehydrogenase